jgi:ribosomal protein L37AE/L43A
MKVFRYILEPYKGMHQKHICPNCGKKTFVRYIDKDTGQYVNDNVGRCDRELKCGYHYTPKEYFKDHSNKYIHFNVYYQKPIIEKVIEQPSYIDKNLFEKSLDNYEQNNFVTFLRKTFGSEVTQKLIDTYKIGTSNHWNGATIFWQIDINGNIRTGKIMQYNPETGRRVKSPYDKITWVHKVINLEKFNLKQCLFGEHLLIDKTKPVGVVESEKTAIIASVFFKDLIFVATGGKQNLNAIKLIPLANRNVIFYPDLGAFDKWNEKVNTFKKMFKSVKVSDCLEKIATVEERNKGLDIVDYLLRTI